MTIQQSGRVGMTFLLVWLLCVQPVVARNISLEYVQIEHLPITHSIPFEPQGMMEDLFESVDKPYKPSFISESPLSIPTPTPHELDAPSSPSQLLTPLDDPTALEVLLSGVKESETVAILSAMTALYYAAPLVSVHPGAVLAVGAFTLLQRHTPDFVNSLVSLASEGVKSSVSFLWRNKAKIAASGMALGSAAYYGYQSHWVREPVLYSYFNNIGPISEGVYYLNSGYANKTLFALDAWLRVEADKDGGRFLHTMVDQLVPAAGLALMPKAIHDWGVYGLGGVATDCLLPKLPGSPVLTTCDIIVKKPMEWFREPASVQVYYSPTAASSLVSIGGEVINTPQLYTAATHYMNLQKFSHVNKIDIGFLLSRVQYYQKQHSGVDIKAADGKEVAVWFQDMVSIDELAEKLAQCIRQEDMAQIQQWVAHSPALGWRSEALAIAGSSATDTPAVPEPKQEDVKHIKDVAKRLDEFTQKRARKDRGWFGNSAKAAAETIASWIGWGARGRP